MLSTANFGGVEFCDDRGYGPPRYLAPQDVVRVADAIAGVDPTSVVNHVDLEAFDTADIYSGAWAENGDWSRGYLVDYLTALREFYRMAAEHGDGVVLWMI